MKRLWILLNHNGSITAMTALVLSAVCILNCTLLDYARYISLKVKYANDIKNACSSVLSSYDSVLAARYGIYGINAINSNDYENKFAYYMTSHGVSDTIDLLGCSVVSANALLSEPLSDAEALKEQITATMKYRTPVRGASYLLEKLGLIKSAENTAKASGIIGEGYALTTKAEEYLSQLKIKTEGYFPNDNMCVNSYSSILTRSSVIVETLRECTRSGLEDASLRETIMSSHTIMARTMELYQNINADALLIIGDMQSLKGEIDAKITEAEALIGELEDSDAEALKEMIGKLKSQAAVISGGSYATKLSENIERLAAKREGLNENIDFLQGEISAETIESGFLDFMSNIRDALYIGDIHTDFSIASFRETGNTAYAQYDSRDSVSGDRDIYGGGGFIIDEFLYNSLPSVTQAVEKERSETLSLDFDSFTSAIEMLNSNSLNIDLDDIADAAVDEILINDYIVYYLTDRCTAGDGEYFKSEIEYIIGGDRDSAANNKTVINRLYTLRFALNLVHVLTDADKSDFAKNIGKSIAAAVSGGVGGTFYALLIMCAWAAGESYLDVRRLVDGEAVALIKKDSDWKLSIDGLLSSVTGNSSDNSGDDDENITNMSYTDYLVILLLIQKTDDKLLRIADVIEVNMTKITGQRYMLSSVYTELRGAAIIEPSYISLAMLGLREEDYQFEITHSADYTS